MVEMELLGVRWELPANAPVVLRSGLEPHDRIDPAPVCVGHEKNAIVHRIGDAGQVHVVEP